MSKLRVALEKIPVLGSGIRFLLWAKLAVSRAKMALGYFKSPLSNLLTWLFRSKENTNFTYDLTDTNKEYLASLIADILNKDFREIAAYVNELNEDMELRQHIARKTEESNGSFVADKDARYGRRLGWYAFVRALKPKIIIETGVDKGMGSCVLAAALKKNKQEGYEGRYYGTDINPEAGYLLSGNYRNYGEILYGDSIETLRAFGPKIDLFINDSDHSTQYEAREYETVASKLAEHAVVLGDNSHGSDKLLKFSLKTGRRFVFFRENPLNHWYPGAGIGISFKRERSTQQE